MALKFFPGTILLLKVDRFEEILNGIKIDEMVNDHLSSCNSTVLKKVCTNIAKNHLQLFATPTITTWP